MNTHSVLDQDQTIDWYWVYYLLAIFDVAAIGLSLYVNSHLMHIYIASVATNQTWVELDRDASQLGELASSINAPGNDVFQTKDFAEEEQNLNTAHSEFKRRLANLTHNLALQPATDSIESMREDLRTVRSATSQMVRDAGLTMNYLQAGLTDRATQYMASMDRRYATVNSTLVRLRARIGALQHDQFKSQTSTASFLQNMEYLIAGLLTLMIAGAIVYGRYIADRAAETARLREEYRQELEVRVAERTAELQESNRARAELLKQLISAQEDERKRISRDLHDSIGQSLTYLVVSLRRMETAEPAQGGAAQLVSVAAATLEEVRRLARGLRPSVLDDVGLEAALDRLAREIASESLSIEFVSDLPAGARLPMELETTLYRVVQECLANIVKHARASQATITLTREGNAVIALIEDNGQGFDLTEAAGRSNRSVGLSSMRERAAIFGGGAQIESEPGRGTRVEIRIPLPAE